MVALNEQRFEERKGEQVEDFSKYDRDPFCMELVDILGRDRILPKKVRTLKSALKGLAGESVLGQESLFFTQDSNLKELHSMLSNSRACKIFLLVDEGLNITQIANELLADEKGGKRPKEFRTYVQYWTNKYAAMRLIRKSEFSRGRETLYEKNEEQYPNMVGFVNYLCIEGLKAKAKEAVRSAVGSRILDRRNR